MRKASLERIGFVLSVAVLAWLYGFAASTFHWFPSRHLLRAWHQARTLERSDDGDRTYVHGTVYDRHGARVVDAGRMQPGLTLITSAWAGDDGVLRPGLRLLDRHGRIVHSWRVEPGELFAESPTTMRNISDVDIQGSYLFPSSGDVLVNLEYAGTLRLDACSRPRWRLREGNHHSIARAEDGTFWIPAVSSERIRGSPDHPDGFPGIDRRVYQDRILNVSPDGRVLRSINVLDVLYENGLEFHLAEEGETDDADPTHLNDADPLPASLADEHPLFDAGDLAVSLRPLDLIFVLDPGTGEVEWSSSSRFIQQHDPDWMGDGRIGVFDNRSDGTDRGTMLGGSRIVAVQPPTDTTRVLFPTHRSDPFYTGHRGKWQQLENGNLLLTEEAAGRAVEVASDGSTVWEWIHAPSSPGRVPAVTGAERTDLTREEVAAWPCSRTTDGGAPASPGSP